MHLLRRFGFGLAVSQAKLLSRIVEKKRGYLFLRPKEVDKKEEVELDLFFYRAKYRSVAFITDLTAGLFKTGHFSGQRGIKAVETLLPTGVNNSPTLIKREISTNVGASDGDVIVLGGLDEDKSSNNNSGLSFLPDWMKSKSGETQILLVLQVQKI